MVLRVQFLGPIRHDDQHGQSVEVPRHVVEDIDRGDIAPMHVVEEEDDGVLAGRLGEEGDHLALESFLCPAPGIAHDPAP